MKARKRLSSRLGCDEVATLKEIAAICNVSVASVSKALNFAPDIGQETAERIRTVAAELGYHPNAAARALKTNRTYNLGVLFQDKNGGLAHDYFVHVLNAVKSTAESRGYDITFISRDIGGMPMTYLEHCRYRGCDGVVIANVDFADPAVLELASSDIPLVSIDFVFDGKGAVISDNTRGMSELLYYVYEKGHRKIAFIHGEATAAATKARMASFYKTCENLGIPVPEEWILQGAFHNPKPCAEMVGQLLAGKDCPTCIFCPDDISAIGAITEIEKNGLSVPRNISVVGYDGIPLSQKVNPVLTTLQQDSEAIGRTAVEMVLEAIENPKTYLPRQIIIPGHLQEGASVGAVSM